MKALTLLQPWAWAVCHAGKRVENRAWHNAPGLLAVARSLVGQRFAVHAAAGTGTRAEFHAATLDLCRRWGDEGIAAAQSRPPVVSEWGDWRPAPSLPRGAIVATARLDAVVRTLSGGHRGMPARIECDLCGQAIPDDGSGRCPAADPWAIPGTVGLILADVRVLPVPVPAKGAQGWWELPDGAPCGARS